LYWIGLDWMEHKNSNKDTGYYSSDIIGHYIINAINGAKYPWKVGDFDERRFFKVRDTSNRVSFFSKEYGTGVSHTLYYETPYEYMKHRNIMLDNEFIKSWYEKKNALYPGEFCYIKI